MPHKLLLTRILPGLAVAFLLAAGVYYVYSTGVSHERTRQELALAERNKAHQEEVKRLEQRIATNEQAHRRASQELSDQLARTNERSVSAIAALRSGYALRVRESEGRASLYERMSEAGAVERANLASHAAQLDRALESGRLLVGELRSTLEQRDEQLRIVGKQLTADRKLISDSATPAK